PHSPPLNGGWGSAAAATVAGNGPLPPAATVDEVLQELDGLDAAGVRPMSIGAAWTQVNLLEAILMADLGAAAYNGLFDGSTAWDAAEGTTALGHCQTMIGQANTDRDGLDWHD